MTNDSAKQAPLSPELRTQALELLNSDGRGALEDIERLLGPEGKHWTMAEAVINDFQLNRAEYFVPITVKIPGGELVLARTGGAERTLIDFIGEVKDEYGTTIQNLRDKVDNKPRATPAVDNFTLRR